jgi:hypothetical protein
MHPGSNAPARLCKKRKKRAAAALREQVRVAHQSMVAAGS